MSDKLLLGRQSLERLVEEFFTIADVLEDLLLENEVPSIDANVGSSDIPDLADDAVTIGGNEMEADIRPHPEECCQPVLSIEAVYVLGEGQVG
jgi:hypothetical protein